MGTIVAVIGAIIIGLIGAWFRAELSAFYEPTIRWLIARSCARLPHAERADAQAELLAMNAGKVSPTWRLIDACSIYLLAHRTRRALEGKRSPGNARRIMRRMIPLAWLSLFGSLFGAPDDFAVMSEMWRQGAVPFLVVMITAFTVQIVGFCFIIRQFRSMRRVTKLMRAGRTR